MDFYPPHLDPELKWRYDQWRKGTMINGYRLHTAVNGEYAASVRTMHALSAEFLDIMAENSRLSRASSSARTAAAADSEAEDTATSRRRAPAAPPAPVVPVPAPEPSVLRRAAGAAADAGVAAAAAVARTLRSGGGQSAPVAAAPDAATPAAATPAAATPAAATPAAAAAPATPSVATRVFSAAADTAAGAFNYLFPGESDAPPPPPPATAANIEALRLEVVRLLAATAGTVPQRKAAVLIPLGKLAAASATIKMDRIKKGNTGWPVFIAQVQSAMEGLPEPAQPSFGAPTDQRDANELARDRAGAATIRTSTKSGIRVTTASVSDSIARLRVSRLVTKAATATAARLRSRTA